VSLNAHLIPEMGASAQSATLGGGMMNVNGDATSAEPYTVESGLWTEQIGELFQQSSSAGHGHAHPAWRACLLREAMCFDWPLTLCHMMYPA